MILQKLAIAKLRAYLKSKNLEAVFLTDDHSLRYFTGFTGGEAVAVVGLESLDLLTDSRYTTQAGIESPDFQIHMISAKEPTVFILSQIVEKNRYTQIAFEDGCVIYRIFHKWQENLPSVSFHTTGEELVKMREVKTDEEIRKIAQAQEIGSRAFAYVLDIIRPGQTELFVAAELEAFMKKAGAENVSFDTIVASGLRSAMPHGVASSKIIEEGDFVTMDFGCVFEGYCSDMTRTIVMGKASKRQKEIYSIVLEAQQEALDRIRPGMTGKEIDAIARERINKAGYGSFFGHGLGHGVGLAIHEEPRLSPGDSTVLESGMIVTVEPGIYIPDFGGVRIENLVAVTEEGKQDLTSAPRELIEINY